MEICQAPRNSHKVINEEINNAIGMHNIDPHYSIYATDTTSILSDCISPKNVIEEFYFQFKSVKYKVNAYFYQPGYL